MTRRLLTRVSTPECFAFQCKTKGQGSHEALAVTHLSTSVLTSPAWSPSPSWPGQPCSASQASLSSSLVSEADRKLGLLRVPGIRGWAWSLFFKETLNSIKRITCISSLPCQVTSSLDCRKDNPGTPGCCISIRTWVYLFSLPYCKSQTRSLMQHFFKWLFIICPMSSSHPVLSFASSLHFQMWLLGIYIWKQQWVYRALVCVSNSARWAQWPCWSKAKPQEGCWVCTEGMCIREEDFPSLHKRNAGIFYCT